MTQVYYQDIDKKRLIGTIYERQWRKDIRLSEHRQHNLPGFGIQQDPWLEHSGKIDHIVIHDVENNVWYATHTVTFNRFSWAKDWGHGTQLFLRMPYWLSWHGDTSTPALPDPVEPSVKPKQETATITPPTEPQLELFPMDNLPAEERGHDEH